MASSSVRHEWYQTDQKVVISVFIKNAQSRNCKVDIKSDSVSLTADDISPFDIQLAHPINESESTFKVLSVKVEISLRKITGEKWNELEKSASNANEPAAPMTSVEAVKSTPATAPKDPKDWDKLVKTIYEKEDLEKTEADPINDLFQKIYSESSPEIQRAMNKSFTESGGTVLSTNWNEVKQQKVEVKPPDGTEFRSWEK